MNKEERINYLLDKIIDQGKETLSQEEIEFLDSVSGEHNKVEIDDELNDTDDTFISSLISDKYKDLIIDEIRRNMIDRDRREYWNEIPEDAIYSKFAVKKGEEVPNYNNISRETDKILTNYINDYTALYDNICYKFLKKLPLEDFKILNEKGMLFKTINKKFSKELKEFEDKYGVNMNLDVE